MPRKTLFTLLSCLALAACGADGKPTAPTPTGVTVSGDAQIGVVSN